MAYFSKVSCPDSCSEVGLAARYGNLEELKSLISQGKPVDVENCLGWNPLHEASASRNPDSLKCMEELLKYIDVNCWTRQKETALFLACKFGDRPHAVQAVTILLDSGANVNFTDNMWVTPLLVATRSGHTDIVKAFLDRPTGQVNIEVVDCKGYGPLQEATKHGRADLVRMLLASGAEIYIGRPKPSPIYIAASRGKVECLRLLLEAAKARLQYHVLDDDWTSYLDGAVAHGFFECVQLLLLHGPHFKFKKALKIATRRKRDGRILKLLLHVEDLKNNFLPAGYYEQWPAPMVNPMHLAIEFQSHKQFKDLLEAGYPVDSSSCYKRPAIEDIFRDVINFPEINTFETPLSLAIWKNDIEVAKTLLSAGARVNYFFEDRVFPPLLSAILNGGSEEIDLLCRYGANFDRPELVFLALVFPRNLRHVLRKGADPRSCFTSNLAFFDDAIFKLEKQETILHVSKLLLEFLECKSKFYDFFASLAERCLSRFQDDYDAENWCGLLDSMRQTSSLSYFCRISLRCHLLTLDKTSLGDRIESLLLPKLLKSYINYDDILSCN